MVNKDRQRSGNNRIYKVFQPSLSAQVTPDKVNTGHNATKREDDG